ncbi:cell wall-binding repeat-containing protein [Euzebya pacifica]|uniref:cell wall-binding repeat-containing protein n=1 Tax=Euzebya pacifica TaxID=1608957 RepID=UPI0030FB9865
MARPSSTAHAVRLHRLATILALVSLLGLLPPAGAQEPGTPQPGLPTERLQGDSRFGTAAAVARAAFERSDTVYVAPGGAFAFALAGGPRAHRAAAPILLTDGPTVPDATIQELQRLQPHEIVVLGGVDVVPEEVATTLAGFGTVRRIAGDNVVDTVARIALDGWPDGADTVYLATAQDFPDALAGGVAAALDDAPILLVQRDYLPPETAAALRQLGPSHVRLLGGNAAITDGVALQLGEVTDAVPGRLGGSTRIHTAVEVNTAVRPSGLDVANVWIATAENFPDAMAATPAVVASDGALLLTRHDCLPHVVRDEIARLAPERIIVLGGPAAVSEDAAALEVCETLPPPPTFEVRPADPVGMEPEVGDLGPRPVAEILDDEGTATRLVEDELVVSTRDEAAFDTWLHEVDGQVLQSIPGSDIIPPTWVVRLPTPGSSFSRVEVEQLGSDLQLLNGIATGHHIVTSDTALSTVATATAAVADGLTVGLNVVAERDELLDGEVEESPNIDGVVEFANPFTWPQFARDGLPGTGTAEAWRLLAANDRADAEVTIGILDSGFAEDNDDYPEGTLGRDGIRNTTPCGGRPCPWHGTDVSVAAAGVLDNQFGSAGAAGPIGRIRQYGLLGTTTGSMIAALATMAGEGVPPVINASLSFTVPAALTPMMRPLEHVTRGLQILGDAVFVASAGNQGLDLNRTDCLPFGVCWERTGTYPCELDGVYCVGGLTSGTRDRHPNSNFGLEACENPVCAVKMFAPFTVLVGANPDNTGNRLRPVNGTSYSAPYVAGVFAMMRAADPDLHALQLIHLMNATAHSSTHPQVGRVVNAYGAVLEALGPDARTVIGANRTPSPFPVDPVPATGFSSVLSTDQGTLRGDGTTPSTPPTVGWFGTLPGTTYWSDAPWAGTPLIAGDVLVVPAVDTRDERRTANEISLFGIDLGTGDIRWSISDIEGTCPPVVDRDGRVWAIRGYEQTNVLEWSFVLLRIDAATGRASRTFSTPRHATGGGFADADPLRDCDGHPLRLSPDGTRLLVWQGEAVDYVRYSSLRLLDITLPDVVETANIRMDPTVPGGAASDFNGDRAWVEDLRVAADRHTAYVLQRGAGDDSDDITDDEWWLHAIDMAGLPRTADLIDPGIIDRSIRLPVGAVDIGAWAVVGDDILVSGEETLSGRHRFPTDGGRTSGRTFRIHDNGTALVEQARQLSDSGAPARPGEFPDRPRTIGVAPTGQLYGHTSIAGLLGIEPAALTQSWRTAAGSFEAPDYGSLLVDASGNAVVAGQFAETVDSVTPTGTTRWSFRLRGDGSVHVGADGTVIDYSTVDRVRLVAITADGRTVLIGVTPLGLAVFALE